MALESVDLLTLLKRARKPVPEAPMDTPASELTVNHLEESIETPRGAQRTAKPVVKVQDKVELADLRAELYADEVLMQRILGLLYRCKKQNPNSGYISILDMERILNVEREGASFVMSYMKTQKVIEMDDKSRMSITVPGIIYLRSVLGVHAASSAPEPEI